MTEISADDVQAFVGLVKDEADALHQLDGAAIKAFADTWYLVDTDVISIRNMDDDELKQAVVEELVDIEYWRRQGKELSYRVEDLVRFLTVELHPRVMAAFADPHVQSFVQRREDGEVRIDPAHLQDAMDFCGAWLEGEARLSDGPVYAAGPGFR